MSRPLIAVLAAVMLAGALSGCTIVEITADRNVGVQLDGFVSGHAGLGWRDENSFLRVSLFQGSLIDITLWRLARLEIGLLGLSAGLGPLHAGFGIFFYDARSPEYGWTVLFQPIEGEGDWVNEDDG